MKKVFSFLLTAVIFISCSIILTACGVDNTSSSTPCTHSYSIMDSKATCTSGGNATYQCSLCGKTYNKYESALGHTTDSGTCTRCGKSFQKEIWQQNYYVDEFNNPTNQAYIKNKTYFIGSFSNSATNNSKLYAYLLIDKDDVAIKMWEYGSYLVKGTSTTSYNITILDDNDGKHYTSGTIYKNGDRIYFSDSNFIISLIKQNEKLKIYLVENSQYGYKSTYLFEVERGNFSSVYSSLI